MSNSAKSICHIQQDCGLCAAFEHEFNEHKKDCKYRADSDCLNLDNNGAICRVCNCPTFDRDKVLKED